MFNKNIYWNSQNISGISNKWSWRFEILFNDNIYTDKDKTVVDEVKQKMMENDEKVLQNNIYSVGSMPVKKMNVVNSYQGGIRMTHPGRVYYDGDLELEFYEDINFNVTKVFYGLLNSRFSNITIMDEDYPYKDSKREIDKIVVTFFDTANIGLQSIYEFHGCWVKEFGYLNNLETKNEEEQLKCKAIIKYNYYIIV